MAFYLARTSMIDDRQIDNVFYFENGFCYCSFEEKQIFPLEDNKVENYILLLNYTIINKIDDFEAVLDTNLNEEELDKVLNIFSSYIIDKEVSIGLLIVEESEVLNNILIFKKYGLGIHHVSIRKHKSITSDFKMCNAMLDIEAPREKRSYKAVVKSKQSDIVLDMSFHELFLMYLRECGKSNVEVYKDGGITRQVFSKILSDKDMRPKKETVICLIIGMELPYPDAIKLLLAAGYALSKSIMSDAVIMKYLKDEIYDLDLINSELAERECPELGWNPR